VDRTLGPVLRELSRIADAAECEQVAVHAAVIAELHAENAALRTEVGALRAAVAHLRASGPVTPAQLRPVIARALVRPTEPADA